MRRLADQDSIDNLPNAFVVPDGKRFVAVLFTGGVGGSGVEAGGSGGAGERVVRTAQVVRETQVARVAQLDKEEQEVRSDGVVLEVRPIKVCSTIRQSRSMIGCVSSLDVSRGSALDCPKRCHIVQLVCNWCLSVIVLWPGVRMLKKSYRRVVIHRVIFVVIFDFLIYC